jgi:predicted TIM-barrel fold metal-dependent hydrolase
LDEQGISTAILSVSAPGVHFGDDEAAAKLARQVNHFAAAITEERPTRFGFFASPPVPNVSLSLEELGHALDDLGAQDVVLESNFDGHYLAEERFEPLLAELDKREAVVFVHPTSPACWQAVAPHRPRPMLEFPFDATRAVAELVVNGVLERHPGIRFIIPHCGAMMPVLGDRIELFRKVFFNNPNGPTTRALLGRLWYDLAGTPFRHHVSALAAMVGTDRIVYGSDYCFTPQHAVSAQIASIDSAPPPHPHDNWRTLTTVNANQLLADRPGLPSSAANLG